MGYPHPCSVLEHDLAALRVNSLLCQQVRRLLRCQSRNVNTADRNPGINYPLMVYVKTDDNANQQQKE